MLRPGISLLLVICPSPALNFHCVSDTVKFCSFVAVAKDGLAGTRLPRSIFFASEYTTSGPPTLTPSQNDNSVGIRVCITHHRELCAALCETGGAWRSVGTYCIDPDVAGFGSLANVVECLLAVLRHSE